jgi:anti-sigma regulatory factor (Ser/Thr protein kinase)
VVAPDGLVSRLYLEVGAPLGLARDDIKEYTVRLGRDWVLALFTDGLVGSRDMDAGVSELAAALSRPGAALAEVADGALAALIHDGVGHDGSLREDAHRDDVALLLARLPEVDWAPEVTEIAVTGDVAGLSEVRAAARAALDATSLGPAAVDTVVLVLSELVGNALLHGRPPLSARMRRFGGRVIVEVGDGGGRLPRRRQAGEADEAGRGLALVSLLTSRWGTRAVADGKIVWAEIDPGHLSE